MLYYCIYLMRCIIGKIHLVVQHDTCIYLFIFYLYTIIRGIITSSTVFDNDLFFFNNLIYVLNVLVSSMARSDDGSEFYITDPSSPNDRASWIGRYQTARLIVFSRSGIDEGHGFVRRCQYNQIYMKESHDGLLNEWKCISCS